MLVVNIAAEQEGAHTKFLSPPEETRPFTLFPKLGSYRPGGLELLGSRAPTQSTHHCPTVGQGRESRAKEEKIALSLGGQDKDSVT